MHPSPATGPQAGRVDVAPGLGHRVATLGLGSTRQQALEDGIVVQSRPALLPPYRPQGAEEGDGDDADADGAVPGHHETHRPLQISPSPRSGKSEGRDGGGGYRRGPGYAAIDAGVMKASIFVFYLFFFSLFQSLPLGGGGAGEER